MRSSIFLIASFLAFSGTFTVFCYLAVPLGKEIEIRVMDECKIQGNEGS